MRLMLSSLALFGLATLALLAANGPDRNSIVLDGQVMDEIRGASPDTIEDTADICAAQNVPPNQGIQTAADCVSGPTYPFGPCVDCGSQAVLNFMSEVSSGMSNGPNVNCNLNVKKTGSCIRDSNGDYYCAKAAADNPPVNCAGTVTALINQGSLSN